MTPLHVSFEIRFRQFFVADFALNFGCVTLQLVSFQHRGTTISFVANIAAENLFSVNQKFMPLESVFDFERSLAHTAQEFVIN
jgi:hypothetical protein